MKEFLLNLLSSSLETIGETKLVEVLQKLHDKNPAQYEVAILGGLQLVVALEPIVLTTGTKIDDALIKSLKDAIQTSVAKNSGRLPIEETI